MTRATSLVAVLLTTLLADRGAAEPITFRSLLAEMIDREAIARFPDPAYTCRQFSSYDRASTVPSDPKGWFANGDAGQYLRVESVRTHDGGARQEWVMAEMDGPGAVVRLWSANPRGTLRVYLDGSTAPAIEAPMNELLGGTWRVGPPLAQEASRGWNLFLPIPYARSCRITSDEGGFYYQVNYRTYEPEATVRTFSAGDLDASADAIKATQEALSGEGQIRQFRIGTMHTLNPGGSYRIDAEPGPRAIAGLQLQISAPDIEQALRSTVLRIEFDGEQTVWCPVGDFFGTGIGSPLFRTWFTGTSVSGNLACRWVMPYARSARITIENTGRERVTTTLHHRTQDWSWDERSMHFHTTWRFEHPIRALGGRGTQDWNYVEVAGRGVLAGDVLTVMNPVPEWWGEGDEKIYVDGESFPSHFGTGTEDYYGYAWCCPVPFQRPFHAQPRCDGNEHGNNWGYTTVTRLRSLDAVPFTQSLKFDMEIWHWKECDVAYAAATYFYAHPGATTNRPPAPADSGRAIPRPPPLPAPFRMEGAIECESLKVLAKSDGLPMVTQDMRSFAPGTWSNERHLWVQGRRPGDFVELEIPTGDGREGHKPVRVTVHATRSWDYGVVQFSVNGVRAGGGVDLFSGERGRCVASGPIDLGAFTPHDGTLVLRAEVVGGHERSEGSKSFFGLDCVILTPAP